MEFKSQSRVGLTEEAGAMRQLEAKHLSFNPNCCQQSGLSNILLRKFYEKVFATNKTLTHTHTHRDTNYPELNEHTHKSKSCVSSQKANMTSH